MFGGTWFESVLNIQFCVFFPFFHDALILDDNQLSGSIPSELGLLTNAKGIDISKFSCRIVDMFGGTWFESVLNIQFCVFSSSS